MRTQIRNVFSSSLFSFSQISLIYFYKFISIVKVETQMVRTGSVIENDYQMT